MSLGARKTDGSDVEFFCTSMCLSTGDATLKSVGEDDIEVVVKNYTKMAEEGERSYPLDSFGVYLLCNKSPKENDIYEVFYRPVVGGERRFGWIFSLQSLLSKEHSFADNSHYLHYARAAFQILLNNQVEHYCLNNELDSDCEVGLDFFYSDKTSILCIDLDAWPHDKKFDLYDFQSVLLNNGFFIQCSTKNPASISFELHSPGPSRIVLTRDNSPFASDYIRYLFSEVVPYESNYLVLFFLMYQVIEMLIDCILTKERTKFARSILTSDNYSFRSSIGDISSKVSEKHRIKLLFSNYLNSQVDNSSFEESCKRFLSSNEIEVAQEDSLVDCFYPVRNFIVHRYHKMKSNSNEAFEEMVSELPYILTHVLLHYKR